MNLNEFLYIVNSKEYSEFLNKVLMKYYGKNNFTTIKIGNDILSLPAFCYPYKDVKPALNIDEFDKIVSVTNNTNRKSLKIDLIDKPLYNAFIGNKIIYPNNLIYALDDFNIDSDGKLTHINTFTDIYKNSTHQFFLLSNEMVKAFKKYADKIDDDNYWDEIKKSLKIRNSLYETEINSGMSKVLLQSAGNKISLLGLSLLVLIRDADNNTYKTFMIKRSNNVALYPNTYQIIPSGGFEYTKDKKGDINDELIKENCSMGYAMFKEYLEELFGYDEIQRETGFTIQQTIRNRPEIKEIDKMLKNYEALFTFMGASVYLKDLAYELSFLLIINNPNYINNSLFKANDEAKDGLISLDIKQLETDVNLLSNLLDSSTMIYKMFVDLKENNKYIKDFINNPDSNFSLK